MNAVHPGRSPSGQMRHVAVEPDTFLRLKVHVALLEETITSFVSRAIRNEIDRTAQQTVQRAAKVLEGRA